MFESPSGQGLADLPAGPQLAGLLDGRSWAGSSGAELIDGLAACERVMSWAAAIQTQVLTELARRRPPGRHDTSRAATQGVGGSPEPGSGAGDDVVDGWVRGPLRYSTFTAEEVAAALGWSWYAADRRLQTAIDLHARLPQVIDALYAGRIDLAKARVVSEGTRGLGGEAATKVALHALRAADRPVTAFKDTVTRAAYAADPALAGRRHASAKSQRRIVHTSQDDGMCLYGAVLPAGQAALVSSAVTAVARDCLASGDGRTLEQARVDSFVDLLLGGGPGRDTGRGQDTGRSQDTDGDQNAGRGQDTDGDQDTGRGQDTGRDMGRGAGRGRGRVRAMVNVTVPVTTLLGAAAGLVSDAGGLVSGLATESTTTPGDPRTRPQRQPRPSLDGQSPTAVPSLPTTGWSPILGAEPSLLPGDVDRSGPLDADQAVTTALSVLSDGALLRWIVTDPLGRAVATAVPGHRRPPWLEQLVKTLDRTCRAPGCRAPAEQCDTDHVIPYPRGGTEQGNLQSLCRRHHRMKTHARWRSRLLPGGVVEWTSPTGHVYTTHPGQWLPPLEPPPWIDATEPPIIGGPPDNPMDEAPPDPGDPADTAAWWQTVAARQPPLLEAAGPQSHPLLGDPCLDNLPTPHDQAHPASDLLQDPWAPADPAADDLLAQDLADPRLYQPLIT